MNVTAKQNWQLNNHNYLVAVLSQVQQTLMQYAKEGLLEGEEFLLEENSIPEALIKEPISFSEVYALDRLCAIFALSDFERNLLLLCAGVDGHRSHWRHIN
jgi:hypothetical protein